MAGYVGSRQFRLNRRYGYTLTIGETMIVCAMIVFFAGKCRPHHSFFRPRAGGTTSADH
jgi:hypothetical protein